MDIISFNEAATANGRIEKLIKDPDSDSGIVTVPKVIGAGESVTVPAGRIAVLPNVQVDGEIIVEGDGEIFIPSGATLSKVVELEGDQTISDIKTFLESPIVPTATEGNQAVNKDYADTKITLATANSYDFGVGQTWQDVTASRSAGVTYTNTTGKPIQVYYIFREPGSTIVTFKINNETIPISDNLGNYAAQYVNFIIPNGSTYNLNNSGAVIVGGNKWFELR